MIGPCTPLEWLIDRYQIKTHKGSGITNNLTTGKNDASRYILDRVKKSNTVMVDRVRISE